MAFVALAVAMVYLAVELTGAVAWWAATGQMFTWARASDARELAKHGGNQAANAAAKPDAVQWTAAHEGMVHPYLGYVHTPPKMQSQTLPISPFGFHGAPPLRRRSDDRYIIGVLGGSVALHFGLYAERELAAALERSPKLRGRRIELVNLALGGYKQPQQLLTLQLLLVLGGEFDCIINLDGFNEVALVRENVPLGVPAWFPRSWARLLDGTPSAEQLRRIGQLTYLSEQRGDRARSAGSWWWSPTAQFLWHWQDRHATAQVAELRQQTERATPAENPATTGPGTNGRTVTESRSDMVALWLRASQQLHALCQQNDIEYCHFLQPNQYVPGSKPIGNTEAAMAIEVGPRWQEPVLDGYPQLQAAGEQLRAQGIHFVDLTNIFQDHPEPLYTDTCCHFNAAGHEIVAQHVAAALRTTLDLNGLAFRSLRITPAQMQITSPLTNTSIEVIGIDDSGQAHDISGSGFGTRITALPAEHVQIGANGSIRAQRRGSAQLHVANGNTSQDIRISASWPDLFDGDDAFADASHQAPRIMANADEVASNAKTLTIVCSGLPKAPMLILATSPSPLPTSSIKADRIGMHLTPIATDAATTTVHVPFTQQDGAPLFVRLYALDVTLADVIAASNTIVITRN